MKRTLIVVVLFVSVLLIGAIGADGQFKRSCEDKPPCKNITSLEDCPKGGCSADDHHDPDLNKLKNLKSSDKPHEVVVCSNVNLSEPTIA